MIWLRRVAAEVVVEGEPSRREMTDMRGEEEEAELGGGWRAMKAMNGREYWWRSLEAMDEGRCQFW